MRALRLATALLFAGCAFVHAEEPNPFYGYVQLMNNYVGRGLSQSVGKPSAQIELDVNPGAGFYGNLSAVHIGWIDKVYPGASVHTEVDGVAGYRLLLGDDATARAGVLRLQFPGQYAPQSPVLRPDTTEVFGYIGWKGLSARINYAITDAYGTADSRGSWYLDTNANWQAGERWSLGVHAGRKQPRGRNPATGVANAKHFAYSDYKVTATRLFGAARSLSLACSWTTADPAIYTLDGYNVGGHHVALTLEQDF